MRVKGGLGPPGCLHPLLKVIYLLRIFSENWIIPGLERFNTFQNGSKRFNDVQSLSQDEKRRDAVELDFTVSWRSR